MNLHDWLTFFKMFHVFCGTTAKNTCISKHSRMLICSANPFRNKKTKKQQRPGPAGRRRLRKFENIILCFELTTLSFET